MKRKVLASEDSAAQVFPIIEVNGPEPGVVNIPITDPSAQEVAMRFWDKVRLIHQTSEHAEDRLEYDNQWGNAVEVSIHRERIRMVVEDLRNFRPILITDALGKVHELNTDPGEVGEQYQAWLDERDHPG